MYKRFSVKNIMRTAKTLRLINCGDAGCTGQDKTNRMDYAPSEDSDQPGHPPSLIRVLAVRSVGS